LPEMKKTDPLRLPLKHEKLPFSDIYLNGRPLFVLPRGSRRDDAKRAIVEHVEMVNRVADLVASGLGPSGRYKLITADGGVTFLTSDAFTIFSKVMLKHPLEQVTAGAGIDVARVTGAGSTTTILLVAEVLNNLLPLIKDGMKQSTVVAGCVLAYKRAMASLDSSAFRPERPLEWIEKIVSTALTGTVLNEHRGYFGQIVRDCVEITQAFKTGEPWRIDDVYVRTQTGGSVTESRVINGLALMREPMHLSMPKSLRRGRLLLVQGEFTVPLKGGTMYYEHTFRATSPEEYRRLLTSKPGMLRSLVQRVMLTKANVILLERGVEDYLIDLFAREGVVLLRRFPPPEWQHVIEVTGALPVSIHTATPSDAVGVGSVEYRRIGDSNWWFLEGFEGPRSCEIFVRGPDTLFLQEAERLLKGCLKSVGPYLRDPRLVYGGGSFELALGEELKRRAMEIESKEQLVVDKVGEALMSIPRRLAASAGLDPIDAMISIRSSNARAKSHTYGVDGISRRIADVSRIPIVEPLHVKRQCLQTAFETIITILRIDNVIQSREYTKEEKHYLERQEKNSPENRKRILKEQGVW
jgi:archaeal chaperonin